MSKKNKPRTGAGLDKLLGGVSIEMATPGQAFADAPPAYRTETPDWIKEIELALIDTNPHQPRTRFEAEELEGLAQSIRELGIITPITVRACGGGRYQIISGERRCRAARMASLAAVPAYVMEADDRNMQIMALVENIQREDLNAIDIAAAYQNLASEYELTQDKISEMVGKKRATIANYLRLLKLPPEIQLAVREQIITMGHAKALMGIEDAEMQKDIARRIVEQELSVREVEAMIKKLQQPSILPSKPLPAAVDEDMRELLPLLKEIFDRHLSGTALIKQNADGTARISIDLKTSEDIQFMIDKMAGE